MVPPGYIRANGLKGRSYNETSCTTVVMDVTMGQFFLACKELRIFQAKKLPHR